MVGGGGKGEVSRCHVCACLRRFWVNAVGKGARDKLGFPAHPLLQMLQAHGSLDRLDAAAWVCDL